MLYFHHFIIIFKFMLQQWFFWLNWKKLCCKNVCAEILRFLYTICIWKCIPTIHYEKKAFDHLHLLLPCCIFLQEISRSENNLTIFWRYLKVIWNLFVKTQQKEHLIFSSQYIFTFLTKCTSNVWMFRYHVIKMNEL